jgi:flagellar operon protein
MNISDLINNTINVRPQQIAADSKATAKKEIDNSAIDFKEILKEKTGLNFSNHAMDRLSGRGVNLDNDKVDRLTKAVQMADKKGADQSLVLLDQLAFLVSVRNKTVITAVETDQMKEGVFTQIDSAIIG